MEPNHAPPRAADIAAAERNPAPNAPPPVIAAAPSSHPTQPPAAAERSRIPPGTAEAPAPAPNAPPPVLAAALPSHAAPPPVVTDPADVPPRTVPPAAEAADASAPPARDASAPPAHAAAIPQPAPTPPDPRAEQRAAELAAQRAELEHQVALLRAQVADTTQSLDTLRSQQAQARHDLATMEALRTAPPRATPHPSPAPDQRPVVLASRTPSEPPAHEQSDAAADVLERLRHEPAPAAPPPEPAPAPRQPSPADTATRHELERARDSLLAGRIDEARRALQVAQLRLVFRPVGPGGGPSAAGHGAADVARALTVLGVGDVSAALRAVSQALAESGTETTALGGAPR